MSFLHHIYKFNKGNGSGISFYILESVSCVQLQWKKLRNVEIRSVHSQLASEGQEKGLTRNLVSKKYTKVLISRLQVYIILVQQEQRQELIIIQHYEEQYFLCFVMNNSH